MKYGLAVLHLSPLALTIGADGGIPVKPPNVIFILTDDQGWAAADSSPASFPLDHGWCPNYPVKPV